VLLWLVLRLDESMRHVPCARGLVRRDGRWLLRTLVLPERRDLLPAAPGALQRRGRLLRHQHEQERVHGRAHVLPRPQRLLRQPDGLLLGWLHERALRLHSAQRRMHGLERLLPRRMHEWKVL
jgi:hypothetical protein